MKRVSQYDADDNFDPVRGGDGGGGKQLVTLFLGVRRISSGGLV